MENFNFKLRIEGKKVISYTTHVATIRGKTLQVFDTWEKGKGWFSKTTTRHIKYVAEHFGLTIKETKPKN